MDQTKKTYPHTEDHLAKGDWNPIWSQLQEMDPEFLEAYLQQPASYRTRTSCCST